MCEHNEVNVWVKPDDSSVFVCKDCGEEETVPPNGLPTKFLPTEAEMKGE